MEISSQEFFGTRTFRHGHFSTPWTFWHCGAQNVCAEMSILLCTVPKCQCWNVLVTKCPHAEKSPWWNVCAEMSLSKMIGAKISPRLPEILREVKSKLYENRIKYEMRIHIWFGPIMDSFLVDVQCSLLTFFLPYSSLFDFPFCSFFLMTNT